MLNFIFIKNMVSYSTTIDKIQLMPASLLPELNDFLDFLIEKKSKTIISGPDDFESDMTDYLHNLENYEELLAKDKIKW